MRDAISAIDQRIAKKAPYPFMEGVVQSVQGTTVRVQLLGSTSTVVAYCDPNTKPEVGKGCAIAYLPNSNRYVVTSLFMAKHSEEIFSNTPITDQELFPPSDLEGVLFPNFFMLRWAAVVNPPVLFEVQLTATDDDPANYYTYLTTTGSMVLIEYPGYDALLRIRSIANNGKSSAWSPDIEIPASVPATTTTGTLTVQEAAGGDTPLYNITALSMPENSVYSLGTYSARFRQNSSVVFSYGSVLTVSDGVFRAYNLVGGARTITKVHLAVSTAPTGADLIVDIHKNGTTIFTNQANRPLIAASATTGSTTTIDVPSWADGDYLTAHIDQVGSTFAGQDLTITLVFYG